MSKRTRGDMHRESSIAYCGCTKEASRSFIQCCDFTCNRNECYQCIMIRLVVNRQKLASWSKSDNYSFRCSEHQSTLAKVFLFTHILNFPTLSRCDHDTWV